MKEARRSSLADDIPKRIFDENAETIQELMAASGAARTTLQTIARKNVQNGRWELVWKRVSGRPVPAYRRAKNFKVERAN